MMLLLAGFVSTFLLSDVMAINSITDKNVEDGSHNNRPHLSVATFRVGG